MSCICESITTGVQSLCSHKSEGDSRSIMGASPLDVCPATFSGAVTFATHPSSLPILQTDFPDIWRKTSSVLWIFFYYSFPCTYYWLPKPVTICTALLVLCLEIGLETSAKVLDFLWHLLLSFTFSILYIPCYFPFSYLSTQSNTPKLSLSLSQQKIRQ